MRVAVCQLNARDDREINVEVARSLLDQAATAGADLAVLPEYTDYLGPASGAPKPDPADGEYPPSSPTPRANLACGCTPARSTRPGRTAGRTTPRWSSTATGASPARYRKIHLYDVEIPGRVSFRSQRRGAGRGDPVVDVEGVAGRPVDLLRPALPRALPAARGGRRAQCWWCRPPSCCTPGATTGRCCCAPGPSRTSATCSPPDRSATTIRAAAASAAAWSSTRGER